jgi:hypothetical protein
VVAGAATAVVAAGMGKIQGIMDPREFPEAQILPIKPD